MPYQIRLEPHRISIAFSGFVPRTEVLNASRELDQLKAGLEHIPDHLLDLSAIEKRETSYELLSSLAEKRRQQTFPNAYRSAIVAPSQLAYGFARMFQTLAENPQAEIQVFHDMASAEAWLAAKP